MTKLLKPDVPYGPASIIGYIVSAAFYLSSIIGSHTEAQWKQILATGLVAATHAGRQYQAAKKP